MPRKKAKKKVVETNPNFIGDYDWKWMLEHPDHPDYKKVMAGARKKKYI